MVTTHSGLFDLIGLVAAAEPASPVIERLDPPRRAAVVMALLGLVLTGLVLVACVMLGAHWVRRLARYKPGNRTTDFAANRVAEQRHLQQALKNILPPQEVGDTMHMDGSTRETKVDPP